MLGKLICKIRKDKKINGAELAKNANIDTGHLSHIERETRTYSPLFQTYDISLSDEQNDYEAQNHIIYDKIPVFDNLVKFTNVPKNFFDSTFALKNTDNSMSSKIDENDYIFVRQNVPLSNKDIGLFLIDNKFIIRKFIIRKNDISLRPENKDFEETVVTNDSNFFIVGKIIGKCDSSFENFVEF